MIFKKHIEKSPTARDAYSLMLKHKTVCFDKEFNKICKEIDKKIISNASDGFSSTCAWYNKYYMDEKLQEYIMEKYTQLGFRVNINFKNVREDYFGRTIPPHYEIYISWKDVEDD